MHSDILVLVESGGLNGSPKGFKGSVTPLSGNCVHKLPLSFCQTLHRTRMAHRSMAFVKLRAIADTIEPIVNELFVGLIIHPDHFFVALDRELKTFTYENVYLPAPSFLHLNR